MFYAAFPFVLVVSSVLPSAAQVDQTAPGTIRVAVAELEAMQAGGTRESSVSVSDGRRSGLAKRILESDPYNAVALEEMGRQHAMTYRWYANFDATKQPLGDGVRNRAMEEFDQAERFLKEALKSDPSRMSALGELVRLYVEEGHWELADEACRRSAADNKDHHEPWLYRGLVAQLQNKSETALKSFDRSIEVMPADLRETFLGAPAFVGDSTVSGVDYWNQRDPWKITATNERLADHYARMAYTDLWYGGQGARGWTTERGLIVLRYGLPWSDASYTSGYSRFNELAYRDFEFVFEDVVRGGHFTMYSPKASQSSSWKNDYVIQAAEMAISNPEQYDPKSLRTFELEMRPAIFKGDSGGVDVYVHVLPYDGDSALATAGILGAFLVDSVGLSLDSSTRSVTMSAEESSNGTLFRLSSKQPIDQIEVEFLSYDRTSAARLRESERSTSFIEGDLSISDLVLASEIEPGTPSFMDSDLIVRPGYTVRPSATSVHNSGEDLLVFFEVYGLEMDGQGRSHFHIEAKLERIDQRDGVPGLISRLFTGSDAQPVAVSVDSEADTPDSGRFISLALPRELTGHFNLSIEVADRRSGKRALASRSVELRNEAP